MKQEQYILRLMNIFPNSFINRLNELILAPISNLYIRLDKIESEFDVKYELLEWCSRDAVKGQPYASNRHNERHQEIVRRGINEYLHTDFSKQQMELIYQKLGNGINHDLTTKFVESGYNMKLLESEEQE